MIHIYQQIIKTGYEFEKEQGGYVGTFGWRKEKGNDVIILEFLKSKEFGFKIPDLSDIQHDFFQLYNSKKGSYMLLTYNCTN